MSMKNFFAWIQAGNFDKPRDADDLHRHRLQEANRRREKRDYYSGDRYDISGTQVGTVGGGRVEGGINIGGDVGTYGGGQPTQRREERPQPTEEKPIPSPGQDDCSAECAEICARTLRAGCAACMSRCRNKKGGPDKPGPPGGGIGDIFDKPEPPGGLRRGKPCSEVCPQCDDRIHHYPLPAKISDDRIHHKITIDNMSCGRCKHITGCTEGANEYRRGQRYSSLLDMMPHMRDK